MAEPSPFPVAPRPFDGASRHVDPGACFDWLRQGWALFLADPGTWLACSLLTLLIGISPTLVPLVGGVATNLLMPILSAGLLDQARRQSRGEDIDVGGLFNGFRQRTGELVLLGVVFTVAIVAVVVVIGILIGGGVAGGLFGASTGRPVVAGAGFGVVLGGLLLGGLLISLALVPLTMAMWFAPALVYFNGMAPVAAMKASFAACLANWLPFLVFSVILTVLCFFATLPLGLGFLVLLPVFSGALYASYRDVFPTS
jgi:uncharacterized membrane protein